MSNKGELVSDLRIDPNFSFDAGNEMDLRCCSCYTYLNKICERCPLCGASPYRPCVHCDFDLR